MKIGIYVYGSAAVAYGITDLIWGEFDPSDQPLQAWGDHVPGATIFALIRILVHRPYVDTVTTWG